MPRKARQHSSSGYYHIMLRGVNQQRVFECEEDYRKFLHAMLITRDRNSLGNPVDAPNCEYLAYCLMDNHIHILLAQVQLTVSDIVHRIATSYSLYFNSKHERVGHLFQDRFKSEPVEDFAYYTTVINYIHNNPVRAGICTHPADYPWSSYREFAGINPQQLCANPENPFSVRPNIQLPLDAVTPIVNLTADMNVRPNEHTIVARILELSNCYSISEFQQVTKKEQQAVQAVLKQEGASLRQLARITGLTIGIVRGAKLKPEE